VAIARKRRLPFSITFILTNRCNFRCSYCDIPEQAGAELTADQWRTAIDELVDAGLARASFSGGEVLLRPDAFEIIGHAKSRGLLTSLNSNAWLAERRMDELCENVDVLMVSLDGPEEVHDLVRRRRGSFERALRAIDRARAAGVTVTTITVINRHNLGVVEQVLDLARAHDFFAYFQPAYDDCFSHSRGLDPALDGAVLRDVASRLERAREDGFPVGASPSYTRRLARGPDFGDCSRCAAGRYFATVMPDGTFVPCHLTSGDHTYPNGLEVGFARAFETMPRPCAGPGCAISPYQEQDLIFGLDPGAIRSAVERLRANHTRR
jgi:MoaA/NifB/PqqE/SkfB family radical SAM enzyme